LLAVACTGNLKQHTGSSGGNPPAPPPTPPVDPKSNVVTYQTGELWAVKSYTANDFSYTEITVPVSLNHNEDVDAKDAPVDYTVSAKLLDNYGREILKDDVVVDAIHLEKGILEHGNLIFNTF